MSTYKYVQVNEFCPENEGWNTIGDVAWSQSNERTILLTNQAEKVIQLSFLSQTALRVRFNPNNSDYSNDNSYAVVNRDLGAVTLDITEGEINGATTLFIKTGILEVHVGLAPYGIAIYKNDQLIHSDSYQKNIVYSNEAVANLKKAPANESYYGFGEKAGPSLDKRNCTMTFFNYDNFLYGDSGEDDFKMIPDGTTGGPLNPTSPLYNTMPFCMTVGKPSNHTSLYSYGLFFDNVSQSYFNMKADHEDDGSSLNGRYYFGALYGDLDYYVLVGDDSDYTSTLNPITSVLAQYALLTGGSAMPPKYALGYQQGCYGYYNEEILLDIAKTYRDRKIPIDGLHIDVDFQNNYRTFTHSPKKFPDPKAMFDKLHQDGFKCSTNITGIVTSNPMDEDGSYDTPYPTRDDILELGPYEKPKDAPKDYPIQKGSTSTVKEDAKIDPFIYNTRENQGENPKLFIAKENYGSSKNANFNTTEYSPFPGRAADDYSLGTVGFYADLGRQDVKEWWGEQYKDLLLMGLDMVWQDMTCPAVGENFDNKYPYKTLPLDMMMMDSRTGKYETNARIHNSFAINLIKATYDGLNKLKSSDEFKDTYNYKKRNFIIARGGYAGVHRYAAIWTGDSGSSWDFLKINIPEILNIGLSGQPLSGSDVGGFATSSSKTSGTGPDGVTNPELFTRWMTSGALLPWYRNHYDGYHKKYQEPFKYSQSVEDNCRKYIEIRYKLIQVFYDAMYENTQNGVPIARAMFLNDPNDPEVYNHTNDQFFLGKDILVAPAIEAGATVYRDVYLPSTSNWYVFNDLTTPLSELTPGGTTQRWGVPLDLVPMYVRQGAIVPLRGLEQYIGELDSNPITFQIYGYNSNRGTTTYTLYQDDETTTAAEEDQAYRVTTISHGHHEGTHIDISRGHDNFTPKEKYFFVAFMGGSDTQPSIQKDTTPSVTLEKVTTREALDNSEQDACFFDAALDTLFMKVFDTAKNVTINF